LLAVAVASIFSLSYGANLALARETGQLIVNWLREDTIVLANGVRWTWGVFGSATDLPDSWYFDLTLHATHAVEVRLLWGNNSTILYSNFGSQFADSFEIALPRTNSDWRWDWQVLNPAPADARILNFTVAHYSVRYPTRMLGFLLSVVSTPILTISALLLVGLSAPRRGPGRS
jgi:hypothetical protein